MKVVFARIDVLYDISNNECGICDEGDFYDHR